MRPLSSAIRHSRAGPARQILALRLVSGTTNPCSAVNSGGPTLTVTFNAAAATTTTLTSSLNPSTYGQSVTFTATVSRASGSGAPVGTVQFKVDGVNLGTPVTLTGVNTTSASATSWQPLLWRLARMSLPPRTLPAQDLALDWERLRAVRWSRRQHRRRLWRSTILRKPTTARLRRLLS